MTRGNAPLPDVKNQNWLAMLRPEAIGENKSQIPIRYPAFDDNFPPIEEKMEFKKIHTVVPLRFNFVAPIQVKKKTCLKLYTMIIYNVLKMFTMNIVCI